MVSRREHAGLWVCSAENEAGIEKLEIFLDVWFSPSVQISFEADAELLGDSVTLECRVTGNPLPSITWRKGGYPVVDDGTHVIHNVANLTISHLEAHNPGNYTCLAKNDVGFAESTVLIDVLVPPSIDREHVDLSPRLHIGQTLLLSCNANGIPEAAVKWYVNGSEISSSTNGIEVGFSNEFIKISNITQQDEGTYECVARNLVGNDTIFYTVRVVQVPTIPTGGAQTVVEGKLASIECAAEGHPPPIISWLRNGIRVESGIQGVRYDTEDKMLIITDVRSSDSGIYVCEATNEAGIARQAYTLEVLVSPRIVSTSPVKSLVRSGSPFSLECGVRGYPEPIVSWSLNGVSIHEQTRGTIIENNGTLTVETASSDSPLTYKCTADNGAGHDEVTYEIHVITALEARFRTINSTEGEPTTLGCDIVSGSFRIHWFKDDISLLAMSKVVFNEGRTALKLFSTKLTDEGKYVCIVENSAGRAVKISQLYVNDCTETWTRKNSEH
nr:Immunoglobulin I-set and Immunoglobulin domain containing protein [Haemonchus contortus]